MRKCVNFRLPLFVFISLMLGIVFSYLHVMQLYVEKWITLSVFLLVNLLYFFISNNFKILIKKLCFMLAFGVFFTMGAFSFYLQTDSYENANLEGHLYNVTARVEDLWETDKGVCLQLSDLNVKGNRTGALKYGAYLYVSGAKLHDYDLGHIINFNAVFEDRTLVYEQRLSSNYVESGIKYTAFIDNEKVKVIESQSNLFEKINVFFRQTLKQNMGEKEFSLSYAMLTGHDDFIEADVLTQFRRAGIAHVFAVSGLHIGFLAALLGFIFKKLRVNKWVSFVITLLVLLFYSGVCSFTASSLRATIMCAVAMLASNSGVKYDGLSALGIAGVIVLLISPVQLLCVGFQLSFVVVAGIIILSSPLSKFLKFLPRKIAKSLSAVISAQLVSIPVCMWSFGWFSTLSVVFNLLFLPVIGFLYVFLFVAVVVGGVANIGIITLFLPNYLFKALTYVITLVDYSVFMIGGISLGLYALTYYAMLLVAGGLINLKTLSKCVVCSVLTVVTVVGCVFYNLEKSKEINIHFIGNSSFCASVITTEDENTLIVSQATKYASISRLGRVELCGEGEIDNLIITAGCLSDDIHLITTKISYLFKVRNIYYYGQKRNEQEQAIKRSFEEGIVISNFSEEEVLPVKSISCSFIQNGYALKCSLADKSILIFSAFGDNPCFSGDENDYDLVVAVDYQDRIFSKIKAREYVSFTKNSKYTNAQTNGNLVYCLN